MGKKSGAEDFDAPMGCYDGAEVCELVGSYMLNQLKHDVIKKVSVYIEMMVWEFFMISPSQKKKERKNK